MPSSVRSAAPVGLSGPPWSRALPVALLVVLLLALATPAAAAPAAQPTTDVPAGAGPIKPGYSRLVTSTAVLQPELAGGDVPRAVFVQLAAVAAAQVWSTTLAREANPEAAALAVRAQRRVVVALAAQVAAAAPEATVLFTVTDAVPGIGLLAPPATLRVLATKPGVVRISAIVPKVPAAEVDGGSPATAVDPVGDWLTGAGVRVGVIDTGIDYLRADLGGAGDLAAGPAAPATAAWRPTARVVGGYDFVGDSYDAAPTTATGANSAYQPVPRPDPDPQDCNGHGTRVADSLAGSGSDSGPTAGRDPAADVPLGVAPQAVLYAFKVFGCSGATDAVIPALDRALDPNQDGDLSDRLDVVDLSLTNSVAAADDPETAVLDALARFGVLPIVAGASGDDPDRASSLSGSVRALAVPAATGDATAAAAGAAALVRQEHPAWTAEQVKAALIDTVDPDTAAVVATTPDEDGQQAAGTGAVQAGAAVGTDVLAYSSTVPGAVSVSFGVVPADVREDQVVATAAVVVQNTGGDPASFSLSYLAAVGQPGVSFAVSPATMLLVPGESTLATVTMTIAPGALHRSPADGTSPQQRNPLTGLDEARQYTASTRGQLLLASPQVTLQVPVSAAVRPVSATSAVDGTLAGSPALVLSGSGFSLTAPGDAGSATQQSLMSVLELGYRSPELPPCARVPESAATSACSAGGPEADLQAVGVGRTPPDGADPGRLWFGLATYQNMTAVGTDVLPTVDIDVNGDNTADYTLQVQAVAGTDLLYALLFDDRPAVASLIDIYPVNFNLGDVDTNAADTNVLLIPVDPTALGYRPGDLTYPIKYSVTLYSAGGAAENAMASDVTPAVDFDVAAPVLTTANPLWQDQGGTGVPYQLTPGSTGVDALVLHLHGADGQRSQVVRLAG